MQHPALGPLMDPILALYEDVKKKALMRLEYEGLTKCEAVTSEGARWHNDPAGKDLHSSFEIIDFNTCVRFCHGKIRILCVF